jgi:hypothetical protein
MFEAWLRAAKTDPPPPRERRQRIIARALRQRPGREII